MGLRCRGKSCMWTRAPKFIHRNLYIGRNLGADMDTQQRSVRTPAAFVANLYTTQAGLGRLSRFNGRVRMFDLLIAAAFTALCVFLAIAVCGGFA